MDWYEYSGSRHAATLDNDGRLDSLAHEWERELASLWRLEADVNNGAYLQFLANWGYDTYGYARAALHKIGAYSMARLIEECQMEVEKYLDCSTATAQELQGLSPGAIVGEDGRIIKEEGSILPEKAINRIMDLSYEFMAYPDDIAALAEAYYVKKLGITE